MNSQTSRHETSSDRLGLIVAVLCFTGLFAALMQTLVIPILPSFPHILSTSAENASWIVTVTLMAAAVTTPVGGRLGDMYGKKRVLLVVMVLLVIGSLICALSDSLLPIILGRALQGTATAAIPLGISIMRDTLPADRLQPSIALMSSTLGVGGAVGLPLAAAIVQYADWHVLFWMSTVLGMLAVVLVMIGIPDSTQTVPGRLDLVGTALLVIGLVALLLGITKGGSWGWLSATTLGLFALSVIVLLVWGWYELRIEQPLVDLRVTAQKDVLFTNLASVLAGFAMYALNIVFPQLLQSPTATGYGIGLSVLAAGLCLAPNGLVMMVMSPVAARISAERGPRFVLILGLVVLGLGYLMSLLLMSAAWQIVIAACVIGAGVAFAYSSLPALIMGSVPIAQTGAANGLNALMRSLGTSSSSAIMSVVLANMTISFAGGTIPSLNAYRVALIISIGATIGAILLALLIPNRQPATTRVAVVEGD